MDLKAAADELYRLPPEEFTAARDEQVRQARKKGHRELAAQIGGLRRPTLAAWASNRLVQDRPEETERFLRLGEELRQAHRELNGARMRELARVQRQLVTALARQARQAAADTGLRLGQGAQYEIEQTLHAVLADPDAVREWASGHLAKALSPAGGFPSADGPAGASGPAGGGARARGKPASAGRSATRTPPGKPGKPGKTDKKASARTRREEADRAAAGQARHAAEAAAEEENLRRRELFAARQEKEAARRELATAEERLAALRRELREAEAEHHTAQQAAERAEQDVRQAEHAMRETRRTAQKTARTAERLTTRAQRQNSR